MTRDRIKTGIQRLKRRISELEKLDPSCIDEIEDSVILGLETSIETTLNSVFSEDSEAKNRFMDAKYISNEIPLNMYTKTSIEEIQYSIKRGKANSLSLLNQAVIYLQEELEFLPNPVENSEVETNQSVKCDGQSVFIVHGHDNEAKYAVERLLSKLKLTPIILHDQTDEGRTIIEKFSDYAEGVRFAVVLLTPDDFGYSKPTKEEDIPEPKARARQNVILELGFFIGKLGRSKVCALHKGEVEIPNDFQGVLFKPMDDSGHWQIDLAKELKAAGLDIDLNKLL